MTDSAAFEALFVEFPGVRPVAPGDVHHITLRYDDEFDHWFWGADDVDTTEWDEADETDALAHCRAACYRRGAERGRRIVLIAGVWHDDSVFPMAAHDSETSALCAMVRAGGKTT